MRSTTYCCALLASLLSSTSVFAAGMDQAPTGTAAPTAAQAQDDGVALQEIVVVARQRSERLQDVPVSVTAVTQEAIQAAGAGDARELTSMVPGYYGGRGSAAFQPTIRGIGSQGVSLADESNVAFYLDGVYQPASLANIVDFVEVRQVEVLRGPQGTLFGRNATGGLINVLTAEPAFEFSGKVTGEYVGFQGTGEYKTTAYVTGPINDTLAANLTLAYRNNGNYITDLVRGGDVGRGHSFTARGKLLWQPSENSEVILTLAHMKRFTEEDSAGTLYEGNSIGNTIPGAIVSSRPYTTAVSLVPRDGGGGMVIPSVNSYVDTGALRTKFDLGFATLQTVHSYMEDRTFQAGESDAASPAISSNSVAYKHKVFTNEVRLLSNGDGPFNWIAGVYAFNLDAVSNTFTYTGVAPTYTVIRTSAFKPQMKTDAYAGFGEGSYDITPQLNLTLGVRYSVERRGLKQTLNGAQVLDAVTGWKAKWTYRGALLYKIDERTNVYATYGTGFKSGVFVSTSTTNNPVAAETVESWEIGIKSQPMPWLRANASIFKSSYDNLQVQARNPVDGTQALFNAAKAGITGGELEVDASATENLSFRLGVSILNAEYDEFPQAQTFVPLVATRPGTGNRVVFQDVSGNKLPRAPSYTLSAGANWTQDFMGGELSLSGNVYRSGRVYFDPLNRLSQKPYTTLAAEIAWTTPDEKLRFRAFGTNITDEVIQQSNQPAATGDRVFFERPQQLGLGMEVRF